IRWEPILVLKDRDLTEANLSYTDIRQIDFSGKKTVFDRADLTLAWAKNAHFNQAQLRGAVLMSAQLQGAWLSDARLQASSNLLAKDSPEVPKLANAFLDAEHCPGARGLTDAEIAKLKELAAKAKNPPPAPKQ